MEDYYHVLRVSPTATSRQIKKAYRKRSRKLHPDRHPEKDTTAKLQRVERAWKILGDAARKQEYDAAREWERGAKEEKVAPKMKSKKRKHCEGGKGDIEMGGTLKKKPKKRKHCEEETGGLEIQETGEGMKLGASRKKKRCQAQDSEDARLSAKTLLEKGRQIAATKDTAHADAARLPESAINELAAQATKTRIEGENRFPTLERLMKEPRSYKMPRVEVKRVKKEKDHWEEQKRNQGVRAKTRARAEAVQMMQIETKRARVSAEARQREFDKREAKRNDAEAKAAWKAETRATPFQFHKLPIEIREMIFEYALSKHNGDLRRRTGLLSAVRFNRELHQEARSVYYGTNDFTFLVLKNAPINDIEPSNLVLIKRMTLMIPCFLNSTTQLPNNLRLITNLQHLNLQPQTELGLTIIVDRCLTHFTKLKTLKIQFKGKRAGLLRMQCQLYQNPGGPWHQSLPRYPFEEVLNYILGETGKCGEDGSWTWVASGDAFKIRERKRHVKFD